jgi:hypothetical protein
VQTRPATGAHYRLEGLLALWTLALLPPHPRKPTPEAPLASSCSATSADPIRGDVPGDERLSFEKLEKHLDVEEVSVPGHGLPR